MGRGPRAGVARIVRHFAGAEVRPGTPKGSSHAMHPHGDGTHAVEPMEGVRTAHVAAPPMMPRHGPHGPSPLGPRRPTIAEFASRSERIPSRPTQPCPVTPSPVSRYRAIARSLSDPHEKSRRAALVKTGIIFDWDDTLMPTTWLIEQKVVVKRGSRDLLDPKLKKILTSLAQEVIGVLSLARQLGTVAIVTNAEDGWVQESAAIFMPELLPILKHLHIVSARHLYTKQFKSDPSIWKTLAFRDVARFLFKGAGKRQLISIGDGEFERTAAVDMGRRERDFVSKSVKLYEHPNHELLRKSLRMILENIVGIVTTPKGLDIMLTTDPKAPDAFAG